MPTIYGDIDGDLIGKAKGHRQVLTLEDWVGGTAFGDATGTLQDQSHGGMDTLYGGDYVDNHLYGDAWRIPLRISRTAGVSCTHPGCEEPKEETVMPRKIFTWAILAAASATLGGCASFFELLGNIS